MIAKKHPLLLLVFFTGLFLVGCATPEIGDPRIILDASAQDLVSVLHVGYDETQFGVKVVDVTIRNNKNYAHTIKVSTQWFANGQAYHSILTEPQSISLLPLEVKTLHKVAPNNKQDSFRIQISKE